MTSAYIVFYLEAPEIKARSYLQRINVSQGLRKSERSKKIIIFLLKKNVLKKNFNYFFHYLNLTLSLSLGFVVNQCLSAPLLLSATSQDGSCFL